MKNLNKTIIFSIALILLTGCIQNKTPTNINQGLLNELEITRLNYPNECDKLFTDENHACITSVVGIDSRNNMQINWLFSENCIENICKFTPTYKLYYPEVTSNEKCLEINGLLNVSTSFVQSNKFEFCEVKTKIAIDKPNLKQITPEELNSLTLPLVCKGISQAFSEKCRSFGIDTRNNERIGWFFGCNDLCTGEEFVLAYTDIENEIECLKKGGNPIQEYGWVSGYWYCKVPLLNDNSFP